MRRWRLSARAHRDFNHIADYLDEHAVEGSAVAQLVEALVSAFDQLTDTPLLGMQRSGLGRGVRSFPVHPYTIYYRVKSNSIDITRILHQRQNAAHEFGKAT